jgi:6-pyruvoyltetrahydropterin/6-carboxytetrahydropterin synthase
MNAELVKTFKFEAAHSLPNVPEGHKCSRLHGHSYRVDIHVSGTPDPQSGWVIDFGDIKRVVEPILDTLDHRKLNDIPGLANSTSENIGQFLWGKIAPELPGLSTITIWESDTSRCTVTDE